LSSATARVEPLVSHRRLEGSGLPPLEWGRRLDVEVAVDEDRGCGVGIARRAQLTERERPAVEVDQRRVPARGADEGAGPLAGGTNVVLVGRIGTDARDAQPLGELLEPGGIDRHQWKLGR
jgi:hypothetical protein